MRAERVCLLAVAGTEAALVLASGMAAISSTLLTLLKAGDHLLIQVRGAARLLACLRGCP